MSSTQNKKNITIRELCTDVANFFEATPIHIFTKSPLEPKLESHKKAAGKNVVLLVSNGVDDITENKSQTIKLFSGYIKIAINTDNNMIKQNIKFLECFFCM